MSEDSFLHAQDKVPKLDKQGGQEEQAGDSNPTNIAAIQTRLITKTVQGLLLNPEEDKNTALARKDNEFVNKRCSLTNNFGPGTNDDTNEQQTYLEKRVDEAFNDKFPNPNPFFFSKRSTKHTQMQE
jgi:hypothetical protein